MSPTAETLPAPPPRTSDVRCVVHGCGDHADLRPSEARIHGTTRQVIRAGAPLCTTCYLRTTPVH